MPEISAPPNLLTPPCNPASGVTRFSVQVQDSRPERGPCLAREIEELISQVDAGEKPERVGVALERRRRELGLEDSEAAPLSECVLLLYGVSPGLLGFRHGAGHDR